MLDTKEEESVTPDRPIRVDTHVVLVDADYEPGNRVPLALRATRLFFGVMGKLLPEATGRLAEKMFFAPRRHREPARETEWLRTATREDVAFENGVVATYRWGRGPRVFLIHGWEGRGTQMGAFIEPLVDAGFEVIAVDMPAHGRSSGSRTNGFIWARALRRLAEHYGEPHAMVTHSFGGTCTMLAMAEGFSTTRAALISPGVQGETFFRGFAEIIGLPEKALAVLRRRVVASFGDEAWHQFTIENQGRSLAAGSKQSLLVHDLGDAEVSYTESVQLVHHTERSRLLTTRGLAHRRILRDPSVVAAIVEFVREGDVPFAV